MVDFVRKLGADNVPPVVPAEDMGVRVRVVVL